MTNPYAGLGLASGIADADALAPVLARILAGKAADPASLLAAWSEARRRKFADAIDKPSRVAYNRVRINVDSQERVDELLARDPVVRALKEGMPVVPPSLRKAGKDLEGW